MDVLNKVSDVAVGEVGKNDVYLYSTAVVERCPEWRGGRRMATMTSNVLAITSQSSHPLYAVGAASGVGWDESTSMIWVPLTPPLNGERVFLLGQGLLQSIVFQRPNDLSDETTWDFG